MKTNRNRMAVLTLFLTMLTGAVQFSTALAEPLMTCQLSNDTPPAAGTVTVEIFLQDAEVRGYETALAISRTAGTGTASVPCPGGVTVETTRTDWLFFGQGNVFGAPFCTELRVAQALLSSTASVGATPAYLATYTIDVPVDARPGSVFEVTILPGSSLSDAVGNPLTFSRGAPCVFTTPPPVPAVSSWGMVLVALTIITLGSLVIRRRAAGASELGNRSKQVVGSLGNEASC